MLGFFSLIVVAFAVYSKAATTNYRRLRTDEVSKIVAFESERVGRTIAEMERNAIDLALAGRQFYLAGIHNEQLGVSISVENFSAFTAAVGGGIWFEPYALAPDTRRACYYAFFDQSAGGVRHAPEFESEAYDYHTQMWYTTIAAGLTGKYRAVWTAPYYDDTGTDSLMTTVGAGIYDENGRFVGMATVDWQIQSVVDRLTAIRPTENSFVLLASTRDDYIISNTYRSGSGQTGLPLSGLPWREALRYSDIGGDAVGMSRFVEGGVEYVSFSRLLDNGGLFSIQIPSREIFAEIEARNNRFTFIIAASSIVLLALAAWLLSLFINRPLHRLTSSVAEMGGGNLDRRIEVRSRDEIGILAAAFNKMTVELKTSIERHALERAEKERIGAELDIATQIQTNMLPCTFPPFPDRAEFDIYATMKPAKEVGGDFYDFFLIDDNTLAVVIADVSSKGVPAALFMVIAKTLIKNNALYGKSPREVFETVNNLLCENNEANMFVTAFMGYLDITNGRFTFVNAGHNPPLVKRAGGCYERLPVKPGFVLAGMVDTFYVQDEIILHTGDEIFLYTDGVTDEANGENHLFGAMRLLDAVNRYHDLALKEFTMAIQGEIDRFTDGVEQADDIAMLALRYLRKP